MSDTNQTPAAEAPVDAATREAHGAGTSSSPSGPALPVGSARLQAIHDLVSSGHYHVPATVIADRMVERMLAARGRPKY